MDGLDQIVDYVVSKSLPPEFFWHLQASRLRPLEVERLARDAGCGPLTVAAVRGMGNPKTKGMKP